MYTPHFPHANPGADAYIYAENACLACIFSLNIDISPLLAPTWTGLLRNSHEKIQFFSHLFLGESPVYLSLLKKAKSSDLYFSCKRCLNLPYFSISPLITLYSGKDCISCFNLSPFSPSYYSVDIY